MADFTPTLAEFWTLLVYMLFGLAVLLFTMWYQQRLIAQVVSFLLRSYLWPKARIWIDVESIRIAPLGGKILFKNLRYHSCNESFTILQGHITFRYWLRHVRDDLNDPGGYVENTISSASLLSSTSISSPTRDGEASSPKPAILASRWWLHVDGFEWFIYNRTGIYDQLLKQFSHVLPKPTVVPSSGSSTGVRPGGTARGQPSPQMNHRASSHRRSSFSSAHSPTASSFRDASMDDGGASTVLIDMSTSDTTDVDTSVDTPATLQDFILKVLPVELSFGKGSILMGNSEIPSISAIQLQSGNGVIKAGKAASAADPYRVSYHLFFEKAKWVLTPNVDYKNASFTTGDVFGPVIQQRNNETVKGAVMSFLGRRAPILRDLIVLISPHTAAEELKTQHEEEANEPWRGLHRYQEASTLDKVKQLMYFEEYARSNVVIECQSIDVNYYADAQGPVVATRQSVSSHLSASAGPVWGIHLTCTETVIHYGPWADKQRNELQAFLIPYAYRDAAPNPAPGMGEARPYSLLHLQVAFVGETVWRLPIRETSKDWKYRCKFAQEEKDATKLGSKQSLITGGGPRPYGWLDFKFPTGASFEAVLPSLATNEKYTKRFELRVPDRWQLSTSLNYTSLMEGSSFKMHCAVATPAAWDDVTNWDLRLDLPDLDVFLLSDHLTLVSDFMADWNDRGGVVKDRFVPVIYNVSLEMAKSRLFLCTNDGNVIQVPNDLKDNGSKIAFLRSMNVCIHLVDLAFLVQKIATTTVQVNLPYTDADAVSQKMTVELDAQHVQIDFNVPSSYTYASMLPKEAQTLASAPHLAIKMSILTNNIADPAHEDVYNIDVVHSVIQGLSPKGEAVTVSARGVILRQLLNIRDNYIGKHSSFCTLDEYRVRKNKAQRQEDLAAQSRRHRDIDDHDVPPPTYYTFKERSDEQRYSLPKSQRLVKLAARFDTCRVVLPVSSLTAATPTESVLKSLALQVANARLQFDMAMACASARLNIFGKTPMSSSDMHPFFATVARASAPESKGDVVGCIDVCGCQLGNQTFGGKDADNVAVSELHVAHVGPIVGDLTFKGAYVLYLSLQGLMDGFADIDNRVDTDTSPVVIPTYTKMIVTCAEMELRLHLDREDILVLRHAKSCRLEVKGVAAKSLTSLSLPTLHAQLLRCGHRHAISQAPCGDTWAQVGSLDTALLCENAEAKVDGIGYMAAQKKFFDLQGCEERIGLHQSCDGILSLFGQAIRPFAPRKAAEDTAHRASYEVDPSSSAAPIPHPAVRAVHTWLQQASTVHQHSLNALPHCGVELCQHDGLATPQAFTFSIPPSVNVKGELASSLFPLDPAEGDVWQISTPRRLTCYLSPVGVSAMIKLQFECLKGILLYMTPSAILDQANKSVTQALSTASASPRRARVVTTTYRWALDLDVHMLHAFPPASSSSSLPPNVFSLFVRNGQGSLQYAHDVSRWTSGSSQMASLTLQCCTNQFHHPTVTSATPTGLTMAFPPVGPADTSELTCAGLFVLTDATMQFDMMDVNTPVATQCVTSTIGAMTLYSQPFLLQKCVDAFSTYQTLYALRSELHRAWHNAFVSQIALTLSTFAKYSAQFPPRGDPTFITRPSNLWRLGTRTWQSEDAWKALAYLRHCFASFTEEVRDAIAAEIHHAGDRVDRDACMLELIKHLQTLRTWDFAVHTESGGEEADTFAHLANASLHRVSSVEDTMCPQIQAQLTWQRIEVYYFVDASTSSSHISLSDSLSSGPLAKSLLRLHDFSVAYAAQRSPTKQARDLRRESQAPSISRRPVADEKVEHVLSVDVNRLAFHLTEAEAEQVQEDVRLYFETDVSFPKRDFPVQLLRHSAPSVPGDLALFSLPPYLNRVQLRLLHSEMQYSLKRFAIGCGMDDVRSCLFDVGLSSERPSTGRTSLSQKRPAPLTIDVQRPSGLKSPSASISPIDSPVREHQNATNWLDDARGLLSLRTYFLRVASRDAKSTRLHLRGDLWQASYAPLQSGLWRTVAVHTRDVLLDLDWTVNTLNDFWREMSAMVKAWPTPEKNALTPQETHGILLTCSVQSYQLRWRVMKALTCHYFAHHLLLSYVTSPLVRNGARDVHLSLLSDKFIFVKHSPLMLAHHHIIPENAKHIVIPVIKVACTVDSPPERSMGPSIQLMLVVDAFTSTIPSDALEDSRMALQVLNKFVTRIQKLTQEEEEEGTLSETEEMRKGQDTLLPSRPRLHFNFLCQGGSVALAHPLATARLAIGRTNVSFQDGLNVYAVPYRNAAGHCRSLQFSLSTRSREAGEGDAATVLSLTTHLFVHYTQDMPLLVRVQSPHVWSHLPSFSTVITSVNAIQSEVAQLKKVHEAEWDQLNVSFQTLKHRLKASKKVASLIASTSAMRASSPSLNDAAFVLPVKYLIDQLSSRTVIDAHPATTKENKTRQMLVTIGSLYGDYTPGGLSHLKHANWTISIGHFDEAVGGAHRHHLVLNKLSFPSGALAVGYLRQPGSPGQQKKRTNLIFHLKMISSELVMAPDLFVELYALMSAVPTLKAAKAPAPAAADVSPWWPNATDVSLAVDHGVLKLYGTGREPDGTIVVPSYQVHLDATMQEPLIQTRVKVYIGPSENVFRAKMLHVVDLILSSLKTADLPAAPPLARLQKKTKKSLSDLKAASADSLNASTEELSAPSSFLLGWQQNVACHIFIQTAPSKLIFSTAPTAKVEWLLDMAASSWVMSLSQTLLSRNKPQYTVTAGAHVAAIMTQLQHEYSPEPFGRAKLSGLTFSASYSSVPTTTQTTLSVLLQCDRTHLDLNVRHLDALRSFRKIWRLKSTSLPAPTVTEAPFWRALVHTVSVDMRVKQIDLSLDLTHSIGKVIFTTTSFTTGGQMVGQLLTSAHLSCRLTQSMAEGRYHGCLLKSDYILLHWQKQTAEGEEQACSLRMTSCSGHLNLNAERLLCYRANALHLATSFHCISDNQEETSRLEESKKWDGHSAIFCDRPVLLLSRNALPQVYAAIQRLETVLKEKQSSVAPPAPRPTVETSVWASLGSRLSLKRTKGRLMLCKEKMVGDTECIDVVLQHAVLKYRSLQEHHQVMHMPYALQMEWIASVSLKKMTASRGVNPDLETSTQDTFLERWLSHLESKASTTHVLSVPLTLVKFDTFQGKKEMLYLLSIDFAGALDVGLNLNIFRAMRDILSRYRGFRDESYLPSNTAAVAVTASAAAAAAGNLPASPTRTEAGTPSRSTSPSLAIAVSPQAPDSPQNARSQTPVPGVPTNTPPFTFEEAGLMYTPVRSFDIAPQLKIVEGATPKEVLSYLGIQKEKVPSQLHAFTKQLQSAANTAHHVHQRLLVLSL